MKFAKQSISLPILTPEQYEELMRKEAEASPEEETALVQFDLLVLSDEGGTCSVNNALSKSTVNNPVHVTPTKGSSDNVTGTCPTHRALQGKHPIVATAKNQLIYEFNIPGPMGKKIQKMMSDFLIPSPAPTVTDETL
ncbi:hypothetical protein ONE63_001692 [Megalurothrips usitatus]|uniref:Uncharacterized protein n=1 Tax=Megalurothrips usitatus TaxID=439358 RepID=A0AAV7XFE5_9NEOP|nr:hypothetical protein ONE63_001692 [Megalurothrips usitatus]